jgi:pre-mRNA-splicing factor 38A
VAFDWHLTEIIVFDRDLSISIRYLRALGAFYLRLTGKSKEIYQYLEPLLNDYRKLRVRAGGNTR